MRKIAPGRFELPPKPFGISLRWTTPRKRFKGHPKTRGRPAHSMIKKRIARAVEIGHI